MERVWAMPSKNTYTIKPIQALLHEEITGFSVDPFANTSNLCDVNNDINSEFHVTTHDALDFLKCHKDGEVDTVVFDPPYSPRQVSDCYKAVGVKVDNLMTSAKFWADMRNEIARVVPIGGTVISFGWNSTGMGKGRGFEIKKILLVAHGGQHNDTICTVETKVKGESTPEYKTKFIETETGIEEVPRN
jgi:hypothetical protein